MSADMVGICVVITGGAGFLGQLLEPRLTGTLPDVKAKIASLRAPRKPAQQPERSPAVGPAEIGAA
jgi:nucleoside-diphosphate-sugar epimerase